MSACYRLVRTYPFVAVFFRRTFVIPSSYLRHTFVIPSSYLRLTVANTTVKLQRNELVVRGCVSSCYRLVRTYPFFAVFFRRTFVIPSSYLRHTFVIPSSYLRLTNAKTSVNKQPNDLVANGCVSSGYRLVRRRSFFAVFFRHTFVIPSSNHCKNIGKYAGK